MLKNSFRAGAAVIGSAVLATTILTGCAGPKVTLDGAEVSNLEKAIESADNLWAQKRASGTASNVDKDSRCYAQTSEGILSNEAICGPIHYLGQDEQIWETMDWEPAGDGKDKVQLTATSSFSKGDPAANATLYRTDGKKAPADLVVPEPDTKTADATQAIWSSSSSSSVDQTKTTVKTYDSDISVSGLKISDRIGNESNRLKAGDGNKFASVQLSLRGSSATSSGPDAIRTELAFVSGGKTYPIGKAKSGGVSMALPGDGKDTLLAVTYEGLTQTVSLADGKLQTKATSYYDGFASTTETPSLQPVEVGEELGASVDFLPKSFVATRNAYEPKAGWAPEGKAWLVLKGKPDASSLQNKVVSGNGFSTATYDAVAKVSAATVKNVSGTAFSGEAKRIDNVVNSGFFMTETETTIVFEVPAGVGDFSVGLTMNANGKTSSTRDGVAPTLSLDGTIPAFELTFAKQ
jgi:hypothetical protein